jgi:hypothetical protein
MGAEEALGAGVSSACQSAISLAHAFRYRSAMHLLTGLTSVVLIALVLFDAFETMVLPRRVTHRFRLTRLYFRTTWACWRRMVRLFRRPRRRLAFLSLFGPLSALGLFCLWVLILIPAFGFLHWSLRTPLAGFPTPGIETYVYLSGVTFFTLGYGDVVPADWLGRALAVGEAGTGLGFMAVIIGYLPVLYQTFSSRERSIGLLDARAGSPPTAAEFLLRLAKAGRMQAMERVLLEWELWCVELLESNLSFPVLCYYRSQHDNQSWLAALTMILDTCAVLLAAIDRVDKYHAQTTFAMARHAVVDLALVFWIPPAAAEQDRLPREKLAEMLGKLAAAGADVIPVEIAVDKLARLRAMYEPFLVGLSRQMLLDLPPFMPDKAVVDNWQTSAWTKRTPGISSLSTGDVDDGHFA